MTGINKLFFRILFVNLFLTFFLSCSKQLPIQKDDIKAELLSQIASSYIDDYDFSFLHISDTRGSDYSLLYMETLLEETDALFGIITGDIVMSDSMREIIYSSSKPIYILPGNHDVFDIYSENGQYRFRKEELDKSPWLSSMTFGDSNSNYYYVDFRDSDGVIRLICLDQYEIDAVGPVPMYCNVISQKQIDWLISVLEDSRDCRSIIIAMHCGFGNSIYGSRDFGNKNSFISSTGGNPDSYEYYGSGDPRIVPDIIEAYKTGENISNYYKSGYGSLMLKAETHFETQSSNFTFYIGGHTHWDVVEYLSYHQNQLQSIISSANSKYPSAYDDVIRENGGINAITINCNRVNTSKQLLQIVRLGARQCIDGTLRDYITFSY